MPFLDELTNSLSAERDREFIKGLSDEFLEQYYAEQSIIRGALQIVASRLLGQRLQEAAGHREMYCDGVNKLEEIRAERRKRLLAPRKVRQKTR
jgi:hypothetical protein